MLRAVEKVEAPDKYTVKFTLKEPFVWFLDMLANPMAVAAIVAETISREAAAHRGSVAPDRVADRLHAAPSDSGRRRGADARREGVRQGPRRAAREARPEPTAARPVLRVAGQGRPRRPRRVAVDEAAGAGGDRPGAARHLPACRAWPHRRA